MQTDGTARRRGRREAAAVAAVSLIPALLALPFLGEPLFGDEAVYSAVGRGLLDGQLPYRDLFDNKPPLLYGWFALSFLLFGAEPWAPRRAFDAEEKEAVTALFDKAIEAGADDVATDGDMYEIYTEPAELHAVAEALEGMGLTAQEAKLTMIPKTTMQIEGTQARTMLKLMDRLEDCEDVQNVYANFDLSEEAMAEAMAD